MKINNKRFLDFNKDKIDKLVSNYFNKNLNDCINFYILIVFNLRIYRILGIFLT